MPASVRLPAEEQRIISDYYICNSNFKNCETNPPIQTDWYKSIADTKPFSLLASKNPINMKRTINKTIPPIVKQIRGTNSQTENVSGLYLVFSDNTKTRH